VCSTRLDALAVGVAAWRLGAGRARKEDAVQAGAGVQMHAKPGRRVRGGEPLFTLHSDTPERFERAIEALEDATTIAPDDARPDLLPLVIDRVSA
jgi:thymidine phosphorylase